jgi:hypothetical protein
MQHTPIPQPIKDPTEWPYESDPTRREPVVDPEDGRVIRIVGYRPCMCCTKPFFSRDISRIRLCSPCKDIDTKDRRKTRSR